MSVTIEMLSEHAISKSVDPFSRCIYGKKAQFSVDTTKQAVFVEFPDNDRITEGYITHIAATLRILFLNSGQIIRFKACCNEVVNTRLKVLNHLSCAINPANYRGQYSLEQNLDAFLKHYKSAVKKYNYINNSIPWLLLLNQISIPLLQLRIEFTLIDMLGRLYTQSKRNSEIFSAFFAHHYNGSQQQIMNDFYTNQILSRCQWRDGPSALKGAFNSIANVIDSIMNNEQAFSTAQDRMSGVIYRLRCRYFHGNMTATYPVDTTRGDFISALEEFCYHMIMSTICELFNKIIRKE